MLRSVVHDGNEGARQLTSHQIAAWDFVREQKPNFDVVTINPYATSTEYTYTAGLTDVHRSSLDP